MVAGKGRGGRSGPAATSIVEDIDLEDIDLEDIGLRGGWLRLGLPGRGAVWAAGRGGKLRECWKNVVKRSTVSTG